MERRSLPHGGAPTVLGLGAAQLGNLYRETTDAEAHGAVQTAWESGIRYFDTAPHYGLGLSERRLGAELAAYPRDEYVLSTKVGRVLDPSPERAHEQDDQGFAVPAATTRRFDLSRDGILRSLEDSLERLGVDRIDIAYLHDPDEHEREALESALPTLIELREQGVLGAVGTGMNQSAMPARFVESLDLDVIMLAGRYTLLEQGALDDLLPLAEQRGVAIVAAGVYNSGLLSRERVAPDATYDYLPAPPELIARANRIAEICEAHGVTLPVAALHFPFRHPAVVSAVVGCRDAAQVAGTIERFDTPVPTQLWDDLSAEGLIR